jgi:hypothetical protein
MSTTATVEDHRPIVPMPRWSTIVGCARAMIAILVLGFSAAACGIWGGSPGFGMALFIVCHDLFILELALADS